MSAPVVETQALGRRYDTPAGPVAALVAADLVVQRGEMVAIMGPSGSGKTTLMNLLGCLDRPSGGRYLLNGVDTSTLDGAGLARLRRTQIGFVFQNFNLLPRLSALDNVLLPLAYGDRSKIERLQLAQAALEAVELGGLGHRRPVELSGGQQQRVAIARALAGNPALILADEPTGALDSRTGEAILAVLRSLHARGTTVIMITHDASVAAHAQRIHDIHDGRLSELRVAA